MCAASGGIIARGMGTIRNYVKMEESQPLFNVKALQVSKNA